MIKKYKEYLGEKVVDIWDEANENTKTLVLYTRTDKLYLRTCKHCNDIVENTPTKDRQMLGNVYQYITICDECNNTFVIDEHQDYSWFLENKDKLKKEL